MPKTNKKLWRRKYWRGAAKNKVQGEGLECSSVQKKKDIDNSVEKEMGTEVSAVAKEIEFQEMSLGQHNTTKKRKKKRNKPRINKIDGLTVKPGMTLAQVHTIVNKLRQEESQKNMPEASLTVDEEALEETEGDDGGSGEDYSDTANERSTEYRKGGYHPVIVGEVYNDRYRIVKKLGWGYFSTVWLVWDYVTSMYQAMKVQKSAKHYTEAAYDEIKLLGEIMTADPEKTHCCARLNDYFEQSGPNGVHVCMVFDVYGEDLLSLIDRYEYRGVPLPIVKSIARQVLVGLEHLHSLEIIHTDLKPENVLLSTPKHAIISLMKQYKPPPLNQRIRLVERDPKTMTKSQRRRYYKKLKAMERNNGAAGGDFFGEKNEIALLDTRETSTKLDGKQQEEKGVESESETDHEWEIERLHHVVLADFGNSCWTYCQFTDEVQTRQYRCPEVILGEPYSTSIDLWSAACLFFELLTGEFLFNPRKGENYSRDEDHLALMTELLGDLPASMRLGSGKYRSQYYNSRGELRNINDLNFWSLEDVLHHKHKFTKKKAEEIADFLLPMLEFDPQKRATASEMLSQFDNFFEIKEDDYAPFCFVSPDIESEYVDSSANGENDESKILRNFDDEKVSGGNKEDRDAEDDMEAIRFFAEHPILSKESLEGCGLTLFDIQTVLMGGRLKDAKLNETAMDIVRRLSDWPIDRGGDDNEADWKDDNGACDSVSTYSASDAGDG